MIDAILATWPVPEDHSGKVIHATSTDQAWVEVKHLVAAGLLPAGTRLQARPGQWKPTEAVVHGDGTLDCEGKTFQTPSGAGKHVKGSVTNGWTFWRLKDGRKLADVRAVYRGERPSQTDSKPSFDWSELHAILERLPEGSWTAYSDLADAVGTATEVLSNHLSGCPRCINTHRVLNQDGHVAENQRTDRDDRRDPLEILRDERVRIVSDRADDTKRLMSDDLTALVAAV
jgi:alkylated DNA nucleotide flippase Atl1